MLPQSIYNPLAKDKVSFLLSGEDTNGAYELVEVVLAPEGGVDLHYHTTFVEEFEPVKGTLGVEVDGKHILVEPGEIAIAPKNSLHRFFNPSKSETIVFKTYIKPARHFEQTLRIAYGLINDGKTTSSGIPKSIWHLALLFHHGESYMKGVPLWLQKGVFGLLFRLAVYLGKQKELEKYYMEEATEPSEGQLSMIG